MSKKLKLSETVLMSDLDGTLVSYDNVISPRNIEAIERYVSKGGRFGIATGRSKELVVDIVAQLPVTLPCVLYNGGVLYDFQTEEYLMQDFITDRAEEYISEIAQTFPHIGVLIISDGKYFNYKEEIEFSYSKFSTMRKKYLVEQTDMTKIPKPWYKVLFMMPEENYDAFFQYTDQRKFEGVRFVGTNQTLVEMLPAHASKGVALETLLHKLSIPHHNLAAIGDFYNDREMIALAGIGATLVDAPEDLKEISDFIAGTCQQGAVADLIEYLESIAE